MATRARRLVLVACLVCSACGSAAPKIASVTVGSPSAFATHAELTANGFVWGPADGTMGAVATGGGAYDFFGAAGSSASCAGSPKTQGAYRFSGTLDHLTGLPAAQCKVLVPVGAAASSGWVFDRNYAGGGSVMPFAGGLLMTYHGEFQWGTLCGSGLQVPCFYGAIGLAVSVDGGATFHSVGQITQMMQPRSAYEGGTKNGGQGYGSMVLADASGKYLAAPPADPTSAYLYVFNEDNDPQLPGPCGKGVCVSVARARFDQVLAAVVPIASSNPATVAALFHKYDASAADPWSEPATSGDPTENTASGHFTPLFTDGTSYLPGVIWDELAHAYLMVHQRYVGGAAQPISFVIRSSTDLLHWSAPLATFEPPAGQQPFYPTLIGETGDPHVGGATPRLFFSTFDTFPDWPRSELDSLPVQITLAK
jgi:hypothetical protein